MALKEKSFEGFETPALAQKDFLYRVKYLKNAKKYQDNGGTLSVKKEKDNKYYWTLTYNTKKIGSTMNRLVKGNKKAKALTVNNMTPKQKANQARFKKVMAEAKKLRAKNKTLTQAQAVKQAWAIMYSKGDKVGYKSDRTNILKTSTVYMKKYRKKGLNRKEAIKQANMDAVFVGATKVKAKKPKRTSEMHTDTKSHNVNIRVVSGLPQEFSLKDAQEYTTKRGKNTKFYFNVFGWDTYYTLKPTFATPTGRAKGFPRIIIFKP